jgi:macrolide transport system ATP-binding/permease protein
VAAVNRTFVKDFFPDGSSPIGRRFGAPGVDSSGDYEIVGVVEDTVYTSARWKDHAMYFVPMMQRPASSKQPIDKDIQMYAGAIVLETEQLRRDIEPLARKTLAAIDPNLTVVNFNRSMNRSPTVLPTSGCWRD